MSGGPFSQAPSVTAFFPCFNDAATIASMVWAADEVLRGLTDEYEILVINDGSQDESAEVLAELQQRCPVLRVITHEANRGYGGALRSGFASATKELVFYTDGDAQYDPRELSALWAELTPQREVIQGWKMERHDGWHRKIIGSIYQWFVCLTFDLHVRDVDCDFRLIRRHVLDSFPLSSDSGSITVELMTRIHQAGFQVYEIPVHHYARPVGRSQFFGFRRIAETLWQLGGLWFRLRLGFDQSGALFRAIPGRME